MYLAFVELDVFSGISVFAPLASTSAPVYPLPPPTTLVGALAYPLLRSKYSREVDGEYSTAHRLLNNVVYATAGAKGYSVSRDVERIYQAIYQRKERWEKLEYKDLWYGIGVRGVATYLDDKLYVVYISRDELVLKYVYGITRVGRKESHVAPRRIIIGKVEDFIKYVNSFETIFYVPTRIAECEDTLTIAMPRLSRHNFEKTTQPELEDFYVPRGLGSMQCNVKDGEGLVLEIDGFTLAVPKVLTHR